MQDSNVRAHNSNLIPTATEFVPRSTHSTRYNTNVDRYHDNQPEFSRNNGHSRNRNYNGRYNSRNDDNIRRNEYNDRDRGRNNVGRYWNNNNRYEDQDSNPQNRIDYGNSSANNIRGAVVHENLSSENQTSHHSRNTKNDNVKESRENFTSEKSSTSKQAYKSESKSEMPKEMENNEPTCQRDGLIMQLNQATTECPVCCEKVKQWQAVWNCRNCYHVFHLWCIRKWAKSSQEDGVGWRCPACQNVQLNVPDYYWCFCGKNKLHGDWNRVDTAHSCGEVCGRIKNTLKWHECVHKCTLLCHPGPCPPCTVIVTRRCCCGNTTERVQCSKSKQKICDSICNKILNCGYHRCMKQCHLGPCGMCRENLTLECYCGKTTVNVLCEPNTKLIKFECKNKCGLKLACENHYCDEVCHVGDCKPCKRLPQVVDKCPCGKMKIDKENRNSCLDPIEVCGQMCGKQKNCGPAGRKHVCQALCHDGECPPCEKQTTIKCRCGQKDKVIPCKDIGNGSEFRCQKKCTKKRDCLKHKCNQVCCIDTEHICPLKCSGKLTCGRHQCELLCHRGRCGRCLQSSFEELYCHCGSSVLYPPIACGTKPPRCDRPCARQHDCDHTPLHKCHSENKCPPCTVFTDKLCYGGHELRKTIPCHQKEFSCGMPCGKRLPCKVHKCLQPCHKGECPGMSEKCTQLCGKSRELCGHACGVVCHAGKSCPNTPCRETIQVTCECGNLVANHSCADHSKDYQNHQMISSTLAAKISDMQLGGSSSVSEVVEKMNNKKIDLRILSCNEECSIIMRNKRLAMCLQIQSTDYSSKSAPNYSEFMKQWAKKNPTFCRSVHDELSKLVQLAKESKQKSRSYSFEVMNKEKRQFVHEYCAFFGCESKAYDTDPKRNVVATAFKDKCWLPDYGILEVVQREMGQRKVPMPFPSKKSRSGAASRQPSASTSLILPVLPPQTNNYIDYFNN